MVIVYLPIEQVEDVSADNGRKNDRSPILAHAIDTELEGQKAREESIQDSIGKSREPRDETKIMWILDLQGTELCCCERQC